MKTLRLAATYRCPLNCPSCYSKHSTQTIPLKMIETIIRQARDRGFDSVAIGGGEPLCAVPETIAAINAAHKLGLRTAVTTSGFNLSDTILRQLLKAGLDHIQLSLGVGRVNLFGAYRFLLAETDGRCSLGVNLLISQNGLDALADVVDVFERDDVHQITLLLPKGEKTTRFTKSDFMRYYLALNTAKRKAERIEIAVDCVTHRLLQGGCEPQGCSFFPDEYVSRCAFGAPRVKWSGSIQQAMDIANANFSECLEARKIEET